MTDGECYVGLKNISLIGKTTMISTLVELKVSGLLVLSKKYYFKEFGDIQFEFCKKYKNQIEMYENGKEFLEIILGQGYDNETEYRK